MAQGTVYASFGNKLALVRGLTERAAEDDRISSALSAIAKASDGGEIAGTNRVPGLAPARAALRAVRGPGRRRRQVAQGKFDEVVR